MAMEGSSLFLIFEILQGATVSLFKAFERLTQKEINESSKIELKIILDNSKDIKCNIVNEDFFVANCEKSFPQQITMNITM